MVWLVLILSNGIEWYGVVLKVLNALNGVVCANIVE